MRPESKNLLDTFKNIANLLMKQGEDDDREYEEIYGKSLAEDNLAGATHGGFVVPGGTVSFEGEPTLGWSNIPLSQAAEKREKEREEAKASK